VTGLAALLKFVSIGLGVVVAMSAYKIYQLGWHSGVAAFIVLFIVVAIGLNKMSANIMSKHRDNADH